MCSAYKQALQVLSSFRVCPTTDSEVLAIKDAKRPEDPNWEDTCKKKTDQSIYLFGVQEYASIMPRNEYHIRDYESNVTSIHLKSQLLDITAITTIIELSRPSKLPHRPHQPCDEYGMLHTPCSHQLSSLQPTWLQCTIHYDSIKKHRCWSLMLPASWWIDCSLMFVMFWVSSDSFHFLQICNYIQSWRDVTSRASSCWASLTQWILDTLNFQSAFHPAANQWGLGP